MPRYVDGFVLPVPKDKVGAYRRIARRAGAVWRDHGALEYVECLADDVKPGKRTSFPQSVKLKDNEIVVFAWIVFKIPAASRSGQREGDEGPAPRRLMTSDAMPFDTQRMFWVDSRRSSRCERLRGADAQVARDHLFIVEQFRRRAR